MSEVKRLTASDFAYLALDDTVQTRIRIIKAVRDKLPISLVDAKFLVDEWYHRGEFPEFRVSCTKCNGRGYIT
jgi:hypothetical protein